MKQEITSSGRIFTALVLALLLTNCNAKLPEPFQAETAASAAEKWAPASAYKDTYLFDLIDGGKKRIPASRAGVTDYAAAFRQMTAQPAKADRHFIRRLTSGPSSRGATVIMADREAVIHTTCQAHNCDQARMAVLYYPDDGRMVGLLWDQCQRTLLGQPNEQEVAALTRIGSMPEPTPATIAKCKREL